jgi:hypothetical protein
MWWRAKPSVCRALQRLERGQSARKYGEIIGTVSQAIGMGCHVHVHNLKSDRAQVQPDSSGLG